jgi:hypothetical protein
VVEQVTPPVAAPVVDINALFDAVAMNESGGDNAAVAMMKQIYEQSANMRR